MTGSIGSRPIAGGVLGGGVELDDEDASRDPRRIRQRVLANRYGRIGMPDEDTTKPTPIYDGLSAADKANVDRLVVGFRMSKQQGIA